MYGAVRNDRNLSESDGFNTFPKVGSSEVVKCNISSSFSTEIGFDLEV